MSRGWQETENPDSLPLDFVLFFLSPFKARKKNVTIRPACCFQELFKRWAFWNPFWKESRGVLHSLVFQVLAQRRLSAPPSSPRPRGLFVQSLELHVSHCWADVITNTTRRRGGFPETTVQFRESTTWLPYREPTLTIISKFKNPLQFTYFMLNRVLCEANTFSVWTICTRPPQADGNSIPQDAFPSWLDVQFVRNGVDVVNRLSTRHLCSWVLCLFSVESFLG